MKNSLYPLIGAAWLGIASFCPVQIEARTPEEIRAYDAAGASSSRLQARRAYDIEYSLDAYARVHDKTARRIPITDFVKPPALWILPVTRLENRQPYDWVPVLEEMGRKNKLLLILPSVSQADAEKVNGWLSSRGGRDYHNPIQGLDDVVEAALLSLQGKDVVVAGTSSETDEHSYEDDGNQANLVKKALTQYPKRLAVMIGADLHWVLPRKDADEKPAGLTISYQDQGVPVKVLYPVNRGNEKEIIREAAERERSQRKFSIDFSSPLVYPGDVDGYIDGKEVIQASGLAK